MLRALLDQILERPDDNELRLVFADALEQSGDHAWAQLIRDQIDGINTVQLEREHGRRIAGPIAEHTAEWKFERGLVAKVAVDVIALAAHVELLGTMPIQSIELREPEGMATPESLAACAALASSPLLARVRTITSHGLGDDLETGEWMTALLASPHLTALEKLVLEAECNEVTARAIVHAHARLPQLRVLRFANNSVSTVGDDGAIAIGESPLCAQLHELLIIGAGVGVRGATALAHGCRDMRTLVLPGSWWTQNPIGAGGAEAIAAAPGLAKLECLDLAGAGIGKTGARAIARAGWIDNLRELDLCDNDLGDDDILAIAVAATKLSFVRVESGVVHGAPANQITEATLAALRGRGIEILAFHDED